MTSRSVAMEGMHLAAPWLEFVIAVPGPLRPLPLRLMLNFWHRRPARGVQEDFVGGGPCLGSHWPPSDPACSGNTSARHRRVLGQRRRGAAGVQTS